MDEFVDDQALLPTHLLRRVKSVLPPRLTLFTFLCVLINFICLADELIGTEILGIICVYAMLWHIRHVY